MNAAVSKGLSPDDDLLTPAMTSILEKRVSLLMRPALICGDPENVGVGTISLPRIQVFQPIRPLMDLVTPED